MNATKTGAQRAKNNGGSGSTLTITGASKLHAAGAFNASGSELYLQIHDAASLTDGAVPACPPVKIEDVSVSLGVQFLDYGDSGRPITTGLIVALSSTAATYTAVGGNFIIDCTYS